MDTSMIMMAPLLSPLTPGPAMLLVPDQVEGTFSPDLPDGIQYLETNRISLNGFLIFYGQQRFLVLKAALDDEEKQRGIIYLLSRLAEDPERYSGIYLWRGAENIAAPVAGPNEAQTGISGTKPARRKSRRQRRRSQERVGRTRRRSRGR